MSAFEMVDELEKDHQSLFGYSNSFYKSIRKSLLHSNCFPYNRWIYRDTPRGNTYLINIKCDSKKSLNKVGMWFDYFAKVNTQEGVYFINACAMSSSIRNNNYPYKPVIIFKPHLFNRYIERFGVLPGYIDIFNQYLDRNVLGYLSSESIDVHHGAELDCSLISTDGVTLGTSDDATKITFKTFLTYDQLNNKQKCKYNNFAKLHLGNLDRYRRERYNNTSLINN